jgi:hypothetical protein
MTEETLPPNPNIFEVPDRADDIATRFPEQVRTMLAMLRMSKLGGLALAECDDFDLRQRLFAYFKDRLADEGIYLYPYEVTVQDLNLVRALRDLTEQPRFKNLEFTGKFNSIVIFVYGMEKYDEAQEARFLYLLNFLRDAFTTIEQTVVLERDAVLLPCHSRRGRTGCRNGAIPLPTAGPVALSTSFGGRP